MPRYFALVGAQNKVEQVVVANDETELAAAGDGNSWVETFMNGENGKNYAGIGDTYDAGMNDFIPPKPYSSWVLSGNEWVPPVAKPATGKWIWDENSQSWIAQVDFG